MTMTGAQTRQGHARTFGFMRRPESDQLASRIATVPVVAWEAPDGTILVWPIDSLPLVQRERNPRLHGPEYIYTAMDCRQ